MEDQKWERLLLCSAPAFAGDAEPPYGFVTSTLARLRMEKRQEEDLERIGWRALLASLAALFLTAGVTLTINANNQVDLEPGLRSVVQMENIPVS